MNELANKWTKEPILTWLQVLQTHFDTSTARRVVDLGCGAGALTRALSEALAVPALGLDRDPQQVDAAEAERLRFCFSPCKKWHSRLKIWEWNRKITLFWRCHRSISWRWGVTSYILCLQLRYHLNIQWSTGADVMLPWPFVAATCRILWPCRGSWSREIWWLAPRFHVNPLDAQRHSCHTLSMGE